MNIFKTKELRFYLVVSYFLLTLALLSTVMSSLTIFMNPETRTAFNIFSYAIIPVLAVPLLVFTLLSYKRHYPFVRMTQIMQIMILLTMSGFAILDDFDSSYGVSMILLSVLLLSGYRLLDRMKTLLIGIFIVAITVTGATLEGTPQYSILVILFDLFFLVTIFLFNRENLRKSIERNRNLELVVDELRNELLDREKIESRITAIQLDVDEFSFTGAERDIITLMCEQGLTSNKALAGALNKSESTIKTQIHSIFEKTGIHKRSSLIAFFRD